MNTLIDTTHIDTTVRTALKLDESTDLSGIAYHETPGWDSLGHMTMVAALEREFDCMLDMDDILEMSGYQKILTVMAKYV